MKRFKNALEFSKHLISKNRYDISVDMTCGNGNDTLMLANLSKKVYAFDIQKEAIEKTKILMDKNNITNVELINESHIDITKFIDEKIDLVVYNLGYLPKGDKKITTKANGVIQSIKNAMKILNFNSSIYLLNYRGHNEGLNEELALEEYIKLIDQSYIDVFKLSHMNGKNKPVNLYIFEKKNRRKR